MVYIACKSLIGSQGRTYSPGDPVEEAESWPLHILKAHLNLGWIKNGSEPPPINEEGIKPKEDALANSKTEETTTMHQCTHCSRKFKTYEKMQNHVVKFHKNKI